MNHRLEPDKEVRGSSSNRRGQPTAMDHASLTFSEALGRNALVEMPRRLNAYKLTTRLQTLIRAAQFGRICGGE